MRDALFTALAKGADRVVMVRTGLESPPDNHTAAKSSPRCSAGPAFDLILTGVRAIDDLDGSLGGLLAGYLNLPYVGLVRKVEIPGDSGTAVVEKEYPGGYAAELEVRLPAVLGIQAAEQPPRYVPVSRLRQVMKTGKVEEQAASPPTAQPSGSSACSSPKKEQARRCFLEAQRRLRGKSPICFPNDVSLR